MLCCTRKTFIAEKLRRKKHLAMRDKWDIIFCLLFVIFYHQVVPFGLFFPHSRKVPTFLCFSPWRKSINEAPRGATVRRFWLPFDAAECHLLVVDEHFKPRTCDSVRAIVCPIVHPSILQSRTRDLLRRSAGLQIYNIVAGRQVRSAFSHFPTWAWLTDRQIDWRTGW